MKLADILSVIDYEEKIKVFVEGNGTIEYELSGDQKSIARMLSGRMLESVVSCIAARDDDTLHVWVEDTNR